VQDMNGMAAITNSKSALWAFMMSPVTRTPANPAFC